MRDRAEIKRRQAEMLLKELRSGEQAGWYYISAVHSQTNTFRGGYVIYAHGPTDAWVKYHALNFHEEGCETLTNGPILTEAMLKIPEEQRWRKLSAEEARNLGK